jgi:hypothetical protein
MPPHNIYRQNSGQMVEYKEIDSIQGVIDKNSHDFLFDSNKYTVGAFLKEWIDNIRENHKNKMWKKHGSFRKYLGIGKNKAVIGIGSGPSLKKNISVLERLYKEHRDEFIFCSPNHQYKPLLKRGIVPDFVFLTDSADTLYPQLCEGVPKNDCVLLVPYHVSPKILKAWSSQKRKIGFFVLGEKKLNKAFAKITGKNPEKFLIPGSGNVFNTIWMLGINTFSSKIFMGVGNDLSFELKDDIDEQRKSFYSDSDYSSNISGTGSGRDEAKDAKHWLSFNIKKNYLLDRLEVIPGKIVGLSETFYRYKTWAEETMMILSNDNPEYGLHYYNCTEGGVLGVMAKDHSDMGNPDNWYMLDTVCSRWHTTTLEHAADQFLRARELTNGKLQQVPRMQQVRVG